MQPPRVLVVTPDAPLATLLDEVLRSQGYDVRVLTAVELAIFASFVPDVVVVDTSELSTHDVSTLRAVDRPLLAISSSLHDAEIATELGVQSFWPLPLDIERFLTELDDAAHAEPARPRLVYSRQERRAPTRPNPGDVKPCPHCGDAMRFLEMPVTGAAWVCRNPECLEVTVVRAKR